MSNRNTLAKKIFTAFVALFVLTGCIGGEGDSEQSFSGAKVSTVFGEVTVPKPKSGKLRVVALGWSDAEAALAVGVKPVGIYDGIGFGGKGVGPWAAELLGDESPTVIARGTDGLNWEQIQNLKPDVILDVRSRTDEKTYKRLSQIAPTVYGPPGTKPFGIGWREQQLQVAKALGREKKGKEAIEKAEKAIEEAKSPHYKALKVAIVGKYAGRYGVFGQETSQWRIFSELGFVFEPKLKELPDLHFGALNLPAEKVSYVDTDLLVVISPHGKDLDDSISKDPLLGSLKVVKEGRVIYGSGLLGKALNASSALSIPEAVKLLKEKLKEIARKFHK